MFIKMINFECFYIIYSLMYWNITGSLLNYCNICFEKNNNKMFTKYFKKILQFKITYCNFHVEFSRPKQINTK